jgi:hypothetical protein
LKQLIVSETNTRPWAGISSDIRVQIQIYGLSALMNDAKYSSIVRGCNGYCIAVPVCTGIPVSRKKILTMTHPTAAFVAAEGKGSLHERRPMRFSQTHSVSLL